LDFILELNNLPQSIKKIIFHKKSIHNKELNCLPNFVEFIQLPKEYGKKILRLPLELKTIRCSKNYKFVNDFANYYVEYFD
jgi:hypothetical protein